MDRRHFTTMQLCDVTQMPHGRKMPLCNGDRRLFDLAGPQRYDAVSLRRKRKDADPIEQTS